MEAGRGGVKYSGGARCGDPAWRVVVVPGRSRLALAWALAIGLAATAAVLAAALPSALRAGIALAIAGLVVHAIFHHAWRLGRGVVERLAVDSSWRIEVDRRGRPPAAGRIAPGTFVAPWLVVVHWIPKGARFARTVFLLPDMAGERELHRLRVILRWGG